MRDNDPWVEELAVGNPIRIARGGMADLFRCTRRLPNGGNRLVVVKRMFSPEEARDDWRTRYPEMVSRFRDEARLGLGLRHANIVHFLEYHEVADRHFIVMEFVDGSDLRGVVRAARRAGLMIPQGVAAHFVEGVASALAHMADACLPDGRELSAVHRDLSPVNLLVSRGGVIKLIDFGIAWAEHRDTHTQAGDLIGKYAYMSPEQIRGRSLDIRSDLFALGSIAYEILAGAKAFDGPDAMAVMNQVDKAVVVRPLPEARPDVHPILAGAVERCMARAPDGRFAHPQELVDAIQRYAHMAAERPLALQAREFLDRLGPLDSARHQGIPGTPRPEDCVTTASIPDRGNGDTELVSPFPGPTARSMSPPPAPGEATQTGAMDGALEGPAMLAPLGPEPEGELEPELELEPVAAPPPPRAEPRRKVARLALLAIVALVLLGTFTAGMGLIYLVQVRPLRAGTAAAPDASDDPFDAAAADEILIEDAAGELEAMTEEPPRPNASESSERSTPKDVSGAPSRGRNDPDGEVADPEDSSPAEPTPETAVREDLPGSLSVTSLMPVEVWIDGRNLGQAPILDLELSAGRHELTAKNDGLDWKHTEWITVRSGQLKQVRLTPRAP